MTGNLHRTIELIESDWNGRSVLVVGDVMLDKYVWGTVERISPEAPVPVVHGFRLTHCPGGAGNVAMNIVGLGGRANVLGFVGADEDANLLKNQLTAGGVTPSLISVCDFPTTSKLRILSRNQQMLRLDFEDKGVRPKEAYESLFAETRKLMSQSSAVVLSDYGKGVLTESVCAELIGEARALGLPVLVDPKSSSFEKYRGATTVCPNQGELALATGLSGAPIEDLLCAGEMLVGSCGFESLTVKLGERGIAVVRKGCRTRAAAVARQVFDVSGAGDTVIATLALCLASGLHVEEAVELANVAAGIVVGKVGTAPIDRNELLGALSGDISLNAEEKVLPRERLLSRVASWRALGQRVVFTNGCFDMLHVGHIQLLEKARQQGDRLIVAVNSDESVQQLKGPSRPIIAEQDRARVLAALAAVDAIVIFGESTPLHLILAVRPDVLVKGGDYTAESIVGANEVRSWGGRVCIVPLVDGISTTKLIAEAALA